MANKFVIVTLMCVAVAAVLSADLSHAPQPTITELNATDPKFSFNDFKDKLVEGTKAVFAGGEYVGEKLLSGAERVLPVAAQAADVVRGTNTAENFKKNNKNEDDD